MQRLKRFFYTSFKDTQGAAAIEAAIVLPVFLVFILAVIGLGHAIMIRHTMFYALDIAGRQAMVSPSMSNADLKNLALGRMSSINTNLVTLSVEDSNSGSATNKVFNASYIYDLPDVIGLTSVTLTANVTVRTN